MITCVAIIERDKDKIWSLSAPARHGEVVKLMRDSSVTDFSKCIQGFLNDKGDFLTRVEAWHEAYLCEQLFLYNPSGNGERIVNREFNPGPLVSEQVW